MRRLPNHVALHLRIVEHDMDIVSRYAARVVAFYDGRVIADGVPARVLDDAEVQRYVIGEAPHAAT